MVQKNKTQDKKEISKSRSTNQRLQKDKNRDDNPPIKEILTANLSQDNATTTINYIENLEKQLIHSQKMESLGQLACGIAHDFNNILGGIMGYTTLLKSKLDPKTETYKFTQIIEKSTQRGAEITQQILDAAKKTEFQKTTIKVNEIIQEVKNILSHTLPKEIEIETNLQPRLPNIQGDHSQIHQVLINLCLNASDAMPEGGTITISTTTETIQPGKHIRVTIKDTGTGIKPSIQEKIFEPFFTTKKPDQGTGLGLAIVKTIINNHKSLIQVESKVNQGTTFTIYLPQSTT